MNPLEQHIQRINEKIQQLLKKHRALQKENGQLKEELAHVRKLQAAGNSQIEELEQKVAILKTATNNMTAEDRKQLEKRINFFVREIDRCIKLLEE